MAELRMAAIQRLAAVDFIRIVVKHFGHRGGTPQASRNEKSNDRIDTKEFRRRAQVATNARQPWLARAVL
jgi:hypothetical protein